MQLLHYFVTPKAGQRKYKLGLLVRLEVGTYEDTSLVRQTLSTFHRLQNGYCHQWKAGREPGNTTTN